MLDPGVRIGPAQIGAAAAVGLRELPCARSPRVAILTTGTELRELGEPLAAGEIYDANAPMLLAALSTSGALVERIDTAADTVESHRAALASALEHDVVITSGGVSVGDHDLVRSVARELGVSERFWRIALRPGKPLSFGVRGSTLVFGLPGNPVSTLVCFELFVRPALYGLQGAKEIGPVFGSGVLAGPVRRNPERDHMIRVRVADAVLEPLPGQESHQITLTARADGLARIPAGTGELPAGTEVAYLPFIASEARVAAQSLYTVWASRPPSTPGEACRCRARTSPRPRSSGTRLPRRTRRPPTPRRPGRSSRATAASSCAFALILSVALAIAAAAPSDGLVLKPWPTPKRSVSAGTTLTSRAGTPSASATSSAYSPSRPSGSVVRLRTILPVGSIAQKHSSVGLIGHRQPPVRPPPPPPGASAPGAR